MLCMYLTDSVSFFLFIDFLVHFANVKDPEKRAICLTVEI